MLSTLHEFNEISWFHQPNSIAVIRELYRRRNGLDAITAICDTLAAHRLPYSSLNFPFPFNLQVFQRFRT